MHCLLTLPRCCKFRLGAFMSAQHSPHCFAMPHTLLPPLLPLGMVRASALPTPQPILLRFFRCAIDTIRALFSTLHFDAPFASPALLPAPKPSSQFTVPSNHLAPL